MDDEKGNTPPPGSASGEPGGGDSDLQKKYEDALKTIDEHKAEKERLAVKLSESNKHTKKAEQEAAEALRLKAEKDGDYKSLLEDSEKRRIEAEEKLTANSKLAQAKEVSAKAMKIASVLAEGENIELLASFVERRLTYHDDSVKVLDKAGQPSVASLKELQEEFAGSAKFSSLVKGNQSSGGGAPGGSSKNGSAATTITRSEFNALNPLQQKEFNIKDGKLTGNKIVND